MGNHVRRAHCRRICRAAEPVVEALHRYKADHGRYPKRLDQIPGMDEIRRNLGVSVQEGKMSRNGIETANLYNADVTVHLKRSCFYCVVPVQKKLMRSRTRFTVYARGTKDDGWRYVWMI